MGAQDRGEHYPDDHLPWDNGVPEPYLVEAVGRLPKGKTLDIGRGTGTSVPGGRRGGSTMGLGHRLTQPDRPRRVERRGRLPCPKPG